MVEQEVQQGLSNLWLFRRRSDWINYKKTVKTAE